MSETIKSAEEIRAAKIAGLRAMADWLEANPAATMGFSSEVSLWVDLAEAREIRKAAPGGWSKGDRDFAVAYSQVFTPDLPEYHQIAYRLYVSKSETCEQVQVGTEHVEAVEAHDKPVFEWRCGPAADDPAE
jgi:hypothetical protein